MEFKITTFLINLVVCLVLSARYLLASPTEKITFKSNSVLELQKPNEGRSSDDISASKAASREVLSTDRRGRAKRAATTANEQDEILRIHNILRQKEEASDMYYMRWNELLASMAATWSTGCNFAHGQPVVNTSSLGYQFIGQNLYAGQNPINLTSAIQYWFDEKFDYYFDSTWCTPGKMCGHYTQIVWSTTYEVGCGYTVCPVLGPVNMMNAAFLICNYGPAGNLVGAKPYQIGAPCTNCYSGQYFCNDRLCDNTCTTSGPTCTCSAPCQNCATVTSNCTCKCKVGWSGNDCSKECKNSETRCGAKSPGWPPYMCASTPTIVKKCPAMCGQCVAGIPLPCVSTTTTPTALTIA